MQIQFVIGDEIKYITHLNTTKAELLKDIIPNTYTGRRNNNIINNSNIGDSNLENDFKQKFKIPINLNTYSANSAVSSVKNKNTSNNNSNNYLNKKTKKINYEEDNFDEDDEDESSYSSDSFNEIEDDLDDDLEGGGKLASSIKSDVSGEENKKLLRKYKSKLPLEVQPYYNILSYESKSSKKSKRELTEDEILKKNDQIQKRKLHAKKMVEEEKRQTIDKILNEDGRKLRERQKKLNEEAAKKEKEAEENYKNSLTKVKLKYDREGKIYLRFPQGLLLPKVLMQKKSNANNNLSNSLNAIKKCQVLNCENDKKYRDPVTKLDYCSVNCYKVIKNSMHIN